MEPTIALQSRLLGKILVEKDVITRAQLQQALAVQERTGGRLGEILVAEFGISRLELAGVLADQWAAPEGAESAATAEPERPVLVPDPVTDAVAGPDRDAATDILAVRIGELERRLDAIAPVSELRDEMRRIAESTELERASLAQALFARVEELTVATPPTDEVGELEARLDELAGRLGSPGGVEDAVTDIRETLAQLDVVRVADALATGARFAGLDAHAIHTDPALTESMHALRQELSSLAARVEERDAEEIVARDDLRIELRGAVAGLERRVEKQAALGEEQVRVTERALRKGLASLARQLAATESTYVDSGNALRRSIERLGAAVVEAEARTDDRALPIEQGCVAFAPTAAGYRLIEIPGAPPELGATIELEWCDGPLVVTRYARSPLPLDPRPCAYLDRA